MENDKNGIKKYGELLQDTRIDPGTYYSYTVRAVKNKTVLSGYNKKGVYAVTNLGYPANLKAKYNTRECN